METTYMPAVMVNAQRTRCRICGGATRTLLDLGVMPPANWLKRSREAQEREFPLVVEACECRNMQLRDCVDAHDLYSDYLYITPKSPTLHEHYETLLSFVRDRGHFDRRAFLLEIGSNVGEFLSFMQPRVRKALGIDPARNICKLANEEGVETICDFFDRASAATILQTYGRPDMIVARHCMAHNADPHSILEGVADILSEDGVLIIENAYALNTIENTEFDQIYHEHMFYFTAHSLSALLRAHGFRIADVLLSPIHGGSIACVARRITTGRAASRAVVECLERESASLTNERLDAFVQRVSKIRDDLVTCIRDLRQQGKTIYSYGATAKGTTLLNFSGLTGAEIAACADSTTIKQGLFLPKAGVEVISEERAFASPPDYFLLTAWNYKDELMKKVRGAGLHDPRFIVPIPRVEVIG